MVTSRCIPSSWSKRWTREIGSQCVSQELEKSLVWTINELLLNIPRVIGPPRSEMPVLIFTDGACEADCTSIGGVLITPSGRVECFGIELPKEIVDGWKKKADQTQVIGQAELLPVLVAKLTWQHEIEGRRAIYFIDNESARLALVKAYSPVVSSLRIVCSCLKWDQDYKSQSWYARVPTFSNIADGPSRFEFTQCLKDLAAEIVVPKLDPSWAQGGVIELGSLRTLHPLC